MNGAGEKEKRLAERMKGMMRQREPRETDQRQTGE